MLLAGVVRPPPPPPSRVACSFIRPRVEDGAGSNSHLRCRMGDGDAVNECECVDDDIGEDGLSRRSSPLPCRHSADVGAGARAATVMALQLLSGSPRRFVTSAAMSPSENRPADVDEPDSVVDGDNVVSVAPALWAAVVATAAAAASVNASCVMSLCFSYDCIILIVVSVASSSSSSYSWLFVSRAGGTTMIISIPIIGSRTTSNASSAVVEEGRRHSVCYTCRLSPPWKQTSRENLS